MPITKSAKKSLRKDHKRRQRNIAAKRQLKLAINKLRKQVLAKDAKAIESLSTVFKLLDKAAKTKVIKTNKAARLKSRLSKAVAKAAVK